MPGHSSNSYATAAIDKICHLCLRAQPLVNSHILPEFVFKPIYDHRHKVVQVGKHERSKTLQKGWRERLLCEDCEARLNPYETDFANQWFENPSLPDRITEEAHLVRGIDYKRFKLFHVSILWRSSVSSLPFFEAVSLGPKWEGIAREMLLDEDPGPPSVFPIYAMALCDSDGSRVGSRVLWDTMMNRIRGQRVYYFLFGGCIWHYVVSNHWPSDYQVFCLRESGEMLFLRTDVNTYQPIVHLAPLLKAGR